ncbi:MAG: hypothetical protein RI911_696 [Candidatus Parcubacteria bacterium]|jgi:hypothetical protein
MRTEATVQTYCDWSGRGKAVTGDGATHDIACYTFDRKGPGTTTLGDVKPGTRIEFDRVGPCRVWRTVE